MAKKITKSTPQDNIPVQESTNKGIPVTDVASAQAALMAQLQAPASEEPVEQEVQTEVEENTSEQAMENAESVEEPIGNSDELTVDDLVEDSQEEEIQEPSTYTVKVDGKDVEVTLEELQAGYSRQADYTRKSQVLAEQRQKADQELAATQQERQRYISQLEQLNNQSTKKLNEFKNVDWEKLKSDDPMEYMTKRDAYREFQDNLRLLKEEKDQVAKKQQEEQFKAFETAKQANYDDLIVRIPEWADPEKGQKVKQSVKEYAESKGFTEQELNMLIDARSIEVLHKAMLYENLLNAKISKKKIKVVPKMQKPGVAQSKGEISSEKVKQQRARLKRTGHINDAKNLIESLLS